MSDFGSERKGCAHVYPLTFSAKIARNKRPVTIFTKTN